MGERTYDELDFDEDDRLPWLEPADGYGDEPGGISPLKIMLLAVAGLALVALVVGAVYGLKQLADRNNATGEVIHAPPGDFKVAAAEADAKRFQGEGDASYATSEGIDRDGRVDPTRVPEAPIAGGGGGVANPDAKPSVTDAKPTVTATVRTVTTPTVVPASSSQASGNGNVIQLGAFGNQTMAQDAWARLSRRFTYLAGLTSTVQPVQVGGATLYRLRASAADRAAASSVCGKLKVAGENCMLVK